MKSPDFVQKERKKEAFSQKKSNENRHATPSPNHKNSR